MSADPDSKQTLILWALLGLGGTAPQKDLGFAVNPKDRNALEGLGLITVERPRGRGFMLEMTDRGWRWAGDHLAAPLPAGRIATKAGTPILHAWLTRIQVFLNAREVSLAELLATVPEGSGEENSSHGRTTRMLLASGDHDGFRTRIRQAYLQVTDNRLNVSVPLSIVKSMLRDVDHEVLDSALIRMHREDDATLVRLMNPREIETERDSAVSFGGQTYHALWIAR